MAVPPPTAVIVPFDTVATLSLSLVQISVLSAVVFGNTVAFIVSILPTSKVTTFLLKDTVTDCSLFVVLVVCLVVCVVLEPSTTTSTESYTVLFDASIALIVTVPVDKASTLPVIQKQFFYYQLKKHLNCNPFLVLNKPLLLK